MEAFISQQPAYDKQLPRNCNARRALNSQHRESFPISNTFMMIWYTDNQWLSGQLPHFLLNLEKWKPVTREMLPLVVLDQKYSIDIMSVSRIRCGTEIYGDFIYSCIYLHKWPTEPNAQLWAKQLKKKKKKHPMLVSRGKALRQTSSSPGFPDARMVGRRGSSRTQVLTPGLLAIWLTWIWIFSSYYTTTLFVMTNWYLEVKHGIWQWPFTG